MITEKSDHIRIEGHRGTWYVIDEGWFILTPDTDGGQPLTIPAHLFLLGREVRRDKAACLIVNEHGMIALENVRNGFDDLEEVGWERVDRQCPVCGKRFPRDEMIFTRDCHGITFRLVCADCWNKVMEKGYDGEYYTEANECIEEDY
jgi:hypothetical protein